MAAGDLSDFQRVMRATARNHARQGQLPFVTEPQLSLGVPEVPVRGASAPTYALQQHLFDPAGFNSPGPLVNQPTLPFEGAPIRPLANVTGPTPLLRTAATPPLTFAPEGSLSAPTVPTAPIARPPLTFAPEGALATPAPVPTPAATAPAAAAVAPVEEAAAKSLWQRFSPGKGGFALGVGLPIAGETAAHYLPDSLKGYSRVAGNVGGLGAAFLPAVGSALGIPGVSALVGAGAAIPAAAGVEALSSTKPGNELINTLRSAPEEHPAWADWLTKWSGLRAFTSIVNEKTKDRPEGPVFGHTEDKLSDVVSGQGIQLPGQGQQTQQAQPQKVPRTPETLSDFMNKVGLKAEYQAKILDEYTMGKESYKTLGIPDPADKNKIKQLTDDEVNELSWVQAARMVPMLKAQQGQDDDFIRQTTSMQAALSQQVPGLLTAGNYSPQQLSREQASLNMIPAFLSMGEYASHNRQLASQIQQAQDMQMLQTQYPNLFPTAQSSSSSDLEKEAQAAQSGGK